MPPKYRDSPVDRRWIGCGPKRASALCQPPQVLSLIDRLALQRTRLTRLGAVHGEHRLVEQDHLVVVAVAVEVPGDGAAIGAHVADLEVIALLHRSWQQEGTLHVVDRVTC